jgi:hypothetical protein
MFALSVEAEVAIESLCEVVAGKYNTRFVVSVLDGNDCALKAT